MGFLVLRFLAGPNDHIAHAVTRQKVTQSFTRVQPYPTVRQSFDFHVILITQTLRAQPFPGPEPNRSELVRNPQTLVPPDPSG